MLQVGPLKHRSPGCHGLIFPIAHFQFYVKHYDRDSSDSRPPGWSRARHGARPVRKALDGLQLAGEGDMILPALVPTSRMP